MVAVGLSAVYLATHGIRTSTEARDWSEAGILAASAVETAVATLNKNPSWRTTATESTVAAGSVGRGTLWYRLDDPNDDFTDNASEPVRITGKATVGKATRVYSVEVAPEGSKGLDILRTALHAEVNAKTDAAVTVLQGPISCDGTLTNTPSTTLNGDVEAGSVTNSGTINGFVTTGGANKQVPAGSTHTALWDAAVTIDFSSLSSDAIRRTALTPGRNPWGDESARGLYRVTVPAGGTLSVYDMRLQATLLVYLGTGATLSISSAVSWEPGESGLPTLIVGGAGTGAVSITSSSTLLREATVGSNFNPAGAPYNGVEDNDQGDDYPSRIAGVIHVTNSQISTTVGAGARVVGTLVTAGSATVRDGAVLTADPALLAAPPRGFAAGDGAAVYPVPGTWRWEQVTW